MTQETPFQLNIDEWYAQSGFKLFGKDIFFDLPPEPKKYKGALFIDIDGTWHRWSLFLHVVKCMIAGGLMPQVAQDIIDEYRHAWERREATYDEYLMKAVVLYESELSGTRQDYLMQTVKNAVLDYRQDVYRFTRRLVQQALGADWLVVAISASPDIAVKPFVRSWGVRYAQGTVMPVYEQDGLMKFSGDRFLIHSAVKVDVVQHCLDTFDLAHLPVERLIVMGDTAGDIPMMAEVGAPLCFNPSSQLYAEAMKRGWLCVDERKDVVKEFRGGKIISAYREHPDGHLVYLHGDDSIFSRLITG